MTKLFYQICAATDTGLKRRKNEDSVVFDATTQLCLLADGMGGYNAGEVASTMATTFVLSELGRWLAQASHMDSDEIWRAMEICVESANHSIFNAARSSEEYAGMGTTLMIGIFQDTRLMLGHVGDSRCYRLRGRDLKQISKDHSLVQEQIDAGLVHPEHAHAAKNKNFVTRALGVEDMVLLEMNEYQVEADDLYLMCSDGLSDMVSDQVIAELMLEKGSLDYKAKKMILVANQKGGRDNISVLLAYAQDTMEKRSLFSRVLGIS